MFVVEDRSQPDASNTARFLQPLNMSDMFHTAPNRHAVVSSVDSDVS